MTEQNLLDYSLNEIHNNNNLGFNFEFPISHNFTEQRKALLNTHYNPALFLLPPIVQQHEKQVLDQSKQQWKNDVSQSVIVINDIHSLSKTTEKAKNNHNTIQSDDQTLTHIVSPEAILEALQEEKEEAMGNKPFSKFTSFNALKQRRYSSETSVSIPCNSPSSKNIAHDEEELEKQEQEPKPQTATTTHQQKLKRPPNAYLLFNRDMRRKLLKSCPKMTVAEISKEIGDSWKSLPNDQREHYVKTASRLKEEHLQKYPGYIYTRRSKAQLAEDKKLGKRSRSEKLNYHYEFADTSITLNDDPAAPSKKRNRKFVSKNDAQRDPRGRKKKRAKHPFAPKHPMSAYLYYVASVYQQVSSKFPGSTVGPISKSISKTWHAMSPEERLPWTQKADSDKARYAREMQVYMANQKQQQQEPVSSSEDEDEVDVRTLEAVVNMVNNSPNGNPMYNKA